MALLKTTISFQTTTLFPNPVNLTIPVNETVDLDAAFNTVTVANAASEVIYGPTGGAVGTSKVTYLYIQAAASNDATDEAVINFDDGTNSADVAKLIPGDFLWIPINAAVSGVTVTIDNSASAVAKTFYYIFAERG
jgi:hypothetical protein